MHPHVSYNTSSICVNMTFLVTCAAGTQRAMGDGQMMRLFWADGRFGWPVIAALVLVTISLLALDLVWRLVVIPFDTLAIYATVAVIAAAAILIAGCKYVDVHFGKQKRT